ncbi:hypothetical protein G6O69_13710 [Pseudenhygromyxa sp. WMMC2535]|uniref:hypothetical protein n=1 Tax=Pseudenhygromyxa sp. WMMC2535 TaxID=2712867 RepID=UPI001557EAF4|nr:hypothetical protein [Pseudenhygromyxa sp. WMMC2535]NVB38893.1 hypothetical protein [Pseudenhygromyxa sp. WMMC2535]
MIASSDARLSVDLRAPARIEAMARNTLAEVLHALRGRERLFATTRVLLAPPETRPGFGEEHVSAIAQRLCTCLHATGLPASVDLAGRGHAGVAQALAWIQAEASHDDSTLFLVVGADSYIDPHTFMWLERERLLACLPSVRSGFVPGEAAACLALTTTATRRRLGLPSLAALLGVGVAKETLLRDSQTGSFGAGMSAALHQALGTLALPECAPDVVYTDINGERYRSEELGFVALRMPEAFPNLDYEAPASCLGDIGAASGAFAAIMATHAWARGYAPGPRAMVMTGSASGLRGVFILQRTSTRGEQRR